MVLQGEQLVRGSEQKSQHPGRRGRPVCLKCVGDVQGTPDVSVHLIVSLEQWDGVEPERRRSWTTQLMKPCVEMKTFYHRCDSALCSLVFY